MKLIFDARHMEFQFTGLGRYTASLLRALLDTKTNTYLQVHIVLTSGVDWQNNMHYKTLSDAGLLVGVDVSFVRWRVFSIGHHTAFARWLNRSKADCYFYPHFDLPFFCRVPSIFVVHDLIPILVKGYIIKNEKIKKEYFKFLLNNSLRISNRCITVSNVTRSDVINECGNSNATKVEVVYEGPVICANESERVAVSKCWTDRPYLLYVGDRRPHKRLDRILKIFFKLNEVEVGAYQLILVGSPINYDYDVDALIENRSDVLVVGNVSDSELASLYKGATSLIFLSDYEGFGLPVVEAAKFNLKMILSDGGALSEISPSHACLIHSSMPDDLVVAEIQKYLLANLDIDCGEYLKGFSWNSAAKSIFPWAYL